MGDTGDPMAALFVYHSTVCEVGCVQVETQ